MKKIFSLVFFLPVFFVSAQAHKKLHFKAILVYNYNDIYLTAPENKVSFDWFFNDVTNSKLRRLLQAEWMNNAVFKRMVK